MAFAAATAFTNKLRAGFVDRYRSAATYTAEAKYCAIGVGATSAARTAAAADTALSSEVETRSAGTSSQVTTSVTGDTYQVVGTVSITANRAIDEAATFDASTGGNIGMSATMAVINLGNGDSLQLTWKAQLA